MGAVALGCALASCAPGSAAGPGARLAAATPAARAPLTRRARLRFDVGGRPFPLPVVRGTVAGEPALMVVDTGASSHVIAGWLARKLGLPRTRLRDGGVDHVGAPIPAWRAAPTELTVEGWGRVAAGPVVVADVPEPVERLGIGAFLSPQQLADEGDALVLDLSRGDMRSAWWDEALADLSSRGSPLVIGGQERACVDSDTAVNGLSYVVPGAIDGQRVELLVDTGAPHSDLFASSAVGVRLLPRSREQREPLYAASGRLAARTVQGVRVEAGAVSVVSDVELVEGSADRGCPRDGVLAMDVLRSCALLLGRERLYGSCARAGDGAPSRR